jgi:hypothetical protein
MNHINSDRDNPLFALAFSSEGELYGYLETKTLDVLLMDENIPLDESKVPVACRMIFMTRDRVDGSEEISHNRIFKGTEHFFRDPQIYEYRRYGPQKKAVQVVCSYITHREVW